jgi:hypothetical protein
LVTVELTTTTRAVEMIRGSGGKRIKVIFYTRGAPHRRRQMTCKYGPPVEGGAGVYDPSEYNLICVYDLRKHDWRSIPYEGIVQVSLFDGDNKQERRYKVCLATRSTP